MPYKIEYFHPRVEVEIEDWPVGILASYAKLVELLEEFGPDLGRPHSKPVTGIKKVYELLPHGSEGIGRAFYCFQKGKRVIILHAFIKKSQKTPERELKTVRNRLKEVQKNGR